MNGNDNLSTRAYLAIGMMLFALFFGAGNLIFPAALGQQAGDNVGWAFARLRINWCRPSTIRCCSDGLLFL